MQQVPVTGIVRHQLGRRMTLNRQGKVLRREATAIIGDKNTGQTALIGLDLNPLGTGIKGVFHQLLHRTGRPFHHLACGDAIDGLIGKAADGHGRSLGRDLTLCRFRKNLTFRMTDRNFGPRVTIRDITTSHGITLCA